MARPTLAVVTSRGHGTPDEFTREQLGKLLGKVEKDSHVKLVATIVPWSPTPVA